MLTATVVESVIILCAEIILNLTTIYISECLFCKTKFVTFLEFIIRP